MRYSYDIPKWDRLRNATYETHHVDVFNGKTVKILNNPGSPSIDYPNGFMKNGHESQSASQFSIMPLIWAFRGDDPQFFHDVRRFELSKGIVAINDRPCLELVKRVPANNRRDVFYLDSRRDFVVVKQVIYESDEPTWQVDISYISDKEIGWIPHKWEYLIRVRSEATYHIVETERRTVTKYVIGKPIADSEYDIEFPPKTRVMDNSGEKSVQYVVKDDMSIGKSIPSVLGPTYEELNNQPSSSRRRYILIAALGGFLAVLATWLWIRRARKGTDKQASGRSG